MTILGISEEFIDEYERKIGNIAEHYGLEHQLAKLQEECGELWAAVHNFKRAVYRYGGSVEMECDEVTEEMVDVLIMIEQINYLLQKEDGIYNTNIDNIVNYKLDRQIKRIEEEKGNE